MMNQMEAQTRALGGNPDAAAKGPGMGRFGLGSGLAGAIMVCSTFHVSACHPVCYTCVWPVPH